MSLISDMLPYYLKAQPPLKHTLFCLFFSLYFNCVCVSHSLAAVLLSWLWWHYANLWTHSSMHATNHAHAQKHTNLPNPTEHCRRFNTHSSLSSCFCSSVVHLHPCRYCSFVPSFRNPIPSSCIYLFFLYTIKLFLPMIPSQVFRRCPPDFVSTYREKNLV